MSKDSKMDERDLPLLDQTNQNGVLLMIIIVELNIERHVRAWALIIW